MYSKTSMEPKTIGVEHEVSCRELLQDHVSLDEILRRNLGFVLTKALDDALLD